MNAKHTPTPWTYNGTDSTILTRTGEFTLIRTNGIGDTRNNAKHLVKCVNMHDELIGALEQLYPYCEGDTSREIIEKTLSKAKE